MLIITCVGICVYVGACVAVKTSVGVNVAVGTGASVTATISVTGITAVAAGTFVAVAFGGSTICVFAGGVGRGLYISPLAHHANNRQQNIIRIIIMMFRMLCL